MTNGIPKDNTPFSRAVNEGISSARKTITEDAPKAINNLQQRAKDTWQAITDPTGEKANKEFIRKTMDANVPPVGTSIMGQSIIEHPLLPQKELESN